MSDESPPPITGLRQRKYPETPMPNHDSEEDDESYDELPRHEEPEEDTKSRLCENVMFFIFVSIAIAHFLTVLTLQADVNILMQYQKEHVYQYKHIAKLLENMHQVKLQMVPAISGTI